MIEIQCTSCHTRYRIDERVLPDDTPTFKCSRCGHVFNADPVPARVRKMAPQEPESPQQPENESQAPRTIRPARPRASELKSPVESDVVKREVAASRGSRSRRSPNLARKDRNLARSQSRPPDRANPLRRSLPLRLPSRRQLEKRILRRNRQPTIRSIAASAIAIRKPIPAKI